MDKQYRRRRRLTGPCGLSNLVWVCGVLLLGFAGSAFASPFSRNIGCAQITGAREREICKSVSDALEWEWFGHAIIAPGWRVTYQTARDAYCKIHIVAADLPLLDGLKNKPVNGDWRLATGSGYLARILKSTDGTGNEPAWSVFSTDNPRYILKGGCSGSNGAGAP